MTREEAIRILDPETTGEALAEIEYYGGFSGRVAVVQAVLDACVLAVAALREKEKRENRKGVDFDAVNNWIPVEERLPDRNGEYICRHGYNGNTDIKFTGVLEYYATDEKPHWQHESIGLIVTHWMPLPELPKEDA